MGARYERPSLPVLLDGLADSVAELWQPGRLYAELAECKLKVRRGDAFIAPRPALICTGNPHRMSVNGSRE
jgi:hypothetical protein